MGKKRRARPARRGIARPTVAAPAAPRTETTVVREPIRPRFTRAGAARATGAPSPSLVRAATAEYGYVAKDMRRIAFTAGGAVLLLAVATVVANFVLR